MFTSIFNATEGNLTAENVMICIISSLALGFIISWVYMMNGSYSKHFAISLVLLPVLVQTVIIMVNGNLGTGIAVLGAFSLVRFRSIPGSSQEICGIFFAMIVGLAVGMGYIAFAFMITIIISLVIFVLSRSPFGEAGLSERYLRVTIPENLDYTEIFDDIFKRFTKKVLLERVKTTNLGSMYELRYRIVLKDATQEKAMIDEIRCRNGNLPVICGRPQALKEEL